MKKLLLFAVAAFFAGSVSAQTTFTKVGTVKKSAPQAAMKIKNMQQEKISSVIPQMAQSHAKGQMKGIDANEFKGLVARPVEHNGLDKKSLHRATANNFARAYLASAEEYFGGSIAKWTMTPDADEEGNACLKNLLPSPWGELNFYYTIEGGVITVPVQKVCQIGTYDDAGNFTPTRDIYFYQPWSDDGSMTMSLAEDGTITMDSRYWYAGAGLRVVNLSTNSWGGYWEIYWRTSFWDIDKPLPPVVYYEPEGTALYANSSPTGYHYTEASLGMYPTFAPATFRNTTLDIADAWTWTIKDGEEQVVATIETEDLSFSPEAGEVYEAPYLSGNNQGTESEAPFQYGSGNNMTYSNMYVGASQQAYFRFSDGSYASMSRACPDFPTYYYSDIATPDLYADNDIANMIVYMGKPEAPLYFEGISWQLYNFVDKGINLKCKIVKVARSSNTLELGEVVAEADVDLENSVINDTGRSTLFWTDFYTVDELGMSQSVDHLFINEEFAIIFEGWDNGTFSAYALGDYPSEVLASPSYSLYYQGYDDEGAFSERVYRMSSSHLLVGLEGAAYGYLTTADNTNIELPAEGGTAKINIGPMVYYNSDEGEAVTGIWLDEDAGSDEIPEWLDVTYTNPVQTGVDKNGDPIYDTSFDLIFTAEALPAGVSERACHLIFYQPGAQLEVNVKQAGDPTGITTTVKKTVTNAAAYNLNGQRVNANYKGIVVKDGVKRINK